MIKVIMHWPFPEAGNATIAYFIEKSAQGCHWSDRVYLYRIVDNEFGDVRISLLGNYRCHVQASKTQ